MKPFHATIALVSLAVTPSWACGPAKTSLLPPPASALPTNPWQPVTYTSADLRLVPEQAPDAVIFDDEYEAIVQAVADNFAQHPELGYKPIAPKTLRTFDKEVLAGSVPEIGWKCSRPVEPERLEQLVFTNATPASLEIRSASYSWQVQVSIGARKGFAMWLPGALAVADWPAEIRKRPFTASGQPNTDVRLKVTRHGLWATSPEDVFPKREQELLACNSPGNYRIAVDAAGRLTRCEGIARFPELPRDDSCVCGVFKSLDWGAGNGDRRTSVEVIAGTYESRSERKFFSYFEASESDDPLEYNAHNAPLFGPGEESIAACFPNISHGSVYQVATTIDVSADGKVTSSKMQWTPKFSASTRTCVESALSRMQFECPLQRHAHIEGVWQVSKQ